MIARCQYCIFIGTTSEKDTILFTFRYQKVLRCGYGGMIRIIMKMNGGKDEL
jgi:hypothetical protein